VPIIVQNNAAHILVTIGGRGVAMLLDTGATNAFLPASLANSLIAGGAAVETAPRRATIANGETIDVRQIMISFIIVGRHTITNVPVGVGPDNAEPLLGFDILSQIGKLTIDAANNQLQFN
jgi:predicted aspartyl protease